MNNRKTAKQGWITAYCIAVFCIYSNRVSAQDPRPCESQEDCGLLETCAGLVVECTEWKDPDDYPDVDPEELNKDYTCETVQVGYCESLDECATDEDCPEASVCLMMSMGPLMLGQCDPRPYPCQSNADCPSPLICYSNECHWEQTNCDSDSQCEEGEVCTLYSEQPIEIVINDDCGEEEDCEPVGTFEFEPVQVCFPKRINCKTDEECPPDMECTDFSELDEFHRRAQRNEPYGPLHWQNPDDLSIVACLSKGLIAVFNDHGEIVREGGMDDRFAGGQDAGIDPNVDEEFLDGGIDDNEGETSEKDDWLTGVNDAGMDPNVEEGSLDGGVDDDAESSEKGDNGGCSFVQIGSGSKSGWFLCGFFLMIFAYRRTSP